MTARDEQKCLASQSKLLKTYKDAPLIAYPLDVASKDSIEEFAHYLASTCDASFDVLVNNAGIYGIDAKKVE
jgi:NADP-dependent 3-hydroxy acid dehydrogenase YdfG